MTKIYKKEKCTCYRLAVLNFILIMVCFCYFAFSADLRTHINPSFLKSLGFCGVCPVNLVNNTITIDRTYNKIRLPEGVNSDILKTINGCEIGDIAILEIDSIGKSVHIKSGQGNIYLPNDFILNSPRDKVMLIKHSETEWHPISIIDNGG